MTLKTSLIINGDSSGAVKAVESLTGALSGTTTSAREAGRTVEKVNGVWQETTSAAQGATQATNAVASGMGQATTAARGLTGAQTQQATAARAAAATNDNLYRSIGQQKAGMFSLGQQPYSGGQQGWSPPNFAYGK